MSEPTSETPTPPALRWQCVCLESLGARRVDIGQGDQTWVVLADPDGNEFCVLRVL